MPDVLPLGDGSTTPRIAWESVLPAADVTSEATTEADGALANCLTWLPWTFWRPTGSGPFTIEAELDGLQTVTAWAISCHDASGLVGMDTWDGSDWVVFAEVIAAGDGAVVYLTGDAIATTKLRFRFNDLSFLGVLWAGEDLILPEGVGPGWTDPVLAQRADTSPEVSRDGVWLGTAVEKWSADLSLDLKNVDEAWARSEWLPFLRRCSTQPFLLHWNNVDAPSSACLCTSAKFGGSAYGPRGFVDLNVSFTADTGYDRRNSPDT